MLEQALHVTARSWGRAAARSCKGQGSAVSAQGRQFRKSEKRSLQLRLSVGWPGGNAISRDAVGVEKGAHMLSSVYVCENAAPEASPVIGTVVGMQRTLADVWHLASSLSDTVRNT